MRYSKTPKPKNFNEKNTNEKPTNLVKKQPSCDHLNHKSNKLCTRDQCKILNNLKKKYDEDIWQNNDDVYNWISSQYCGGWTSGGEGTVLASMGTLDVDDNYLI